MTDKNHTHKSSSNKDVIYVDVEEDITGIVEKVRASTHHIVALVLPKRAAMLQSIVNMKLLKRAGEQSKKNVVLITSEAGLMPLAGSVGLHVAKNLQTKPEVPEVPSAAGQPDKEAEPPVESESESEPDADKPMDKSKTLGELAGDDEPIELDNAEAEEESAPSKQKSKKGSIIKIPNFNKFRSWLILGGGGLLLLIALVVWALIALPKAEVVISTDSTSLTSSGEITLDTGENAQPNADEGIIPAKSVETTRTQRAEVPATGEENKGKKATGSVDMTTEDCSAPYSVTDVPAGTGISSDGKTYITGEKAAFSPTAFDFSTSCWSYKASGVSIAAQGAGKDYNTGSTSFSVAGRSDVEATGKASGGTDKIVKVVTQEDVNKSKDQIQSQDAESVKQELSEQLSGENLYPIEETFATTTSGTDMSAQVGDEAENVTITEEVKYTMLGVKKEDLERVIAADVADEIDPARQVILDYGLNQASFNMQNQQEGTTLIGLRTNVVAGPDLDVNEIKKQIAGKKASDARSIIEENPGVTNVDISYGPFWVRTIPGNTDKITVTVEEPEAAPSQNEDESEDASAQ